MMNMDSTPSDGLTFARARTILDTPQEEPMKAPPYSKPQCPICRGSRIQIRKTDQKAWCRGCLREGPISDFKPTKKRKA